MRPSGIALRDAEGGPCIIQEVHVILNDNRIDSQEFDLMQMATGGSLAALFDSFLGVDALVASIIGKLNDDF